MRDIKQFTKYLTATALILSMAACGTDPGERALSGAGIGAGAGVGAALLGAPLLPALVVGGAVGAVAGAVTTPKEVNLAK